MKIKIFRKVKASEGLLICPLFKEDFKKPPEIFPQSVRKFIKKLQKSKELKIGGEKTIQTYFNEKDAPEKLLIVNKGSIDKFKTRSAKDFGGKVGKFAKSMNASEISIIILPGMDRYIQRIMEGLFSAVYETDKKKTGQKKEEKFKLKKINIVTGSGSRFIKKRVEQAEIINGALELTKDLVNSPSNEITGEYLENLAKDIAKKNRCSKVFFSNKQLQKMGWGGLLAVNKGSRKDARCLVLQYNGADKKKEKPVVIVGKGILFDSGGYNLKPTNYIETMHQDMAGGAAVLGLFSVINRLGIKKNVVGIIPIAENLISEDAYRPSDIITMLNGLTCEITNTDAEGRLILADGMTYGCEFKPEYLITIATLTGAVYSALGDRYAGLLGNNRDLRKKLGKAGAVMDDRGWELPLPKDYKKKMDSKIADIRNIDKGTNRAAGCSKGAAFLERFTGGNKWCHIDIGGTAFTDDPKEYQTKGATAHGLQMLIKFLQRES